MSNYARFIIAICQLLIFIQKANSQYSETNPPFTPIALPKAPSSTALDKFVNYPVSYFSGLPQISIPVYEISIGNLKVPINFSYHASGNKVTDVASWVGLGWALEAGGEIGRKVMGAKADEFGYLHTSMFLASDFDPTTQSDQGNLDALSRNGYDVEPDIFSYSFPGKSGRFFFNINDNYKATPIPYTPVSIKYSLSESGNTITSFVIRDENGNTFYYGNAVGYTSSNSPQPSGAVTSWMLDKIISADQKDSVVFKYTSTSTSTYTDLLDSWIVDNNVTDVDVTQLVYTPSYESHISVSLETSSTTEVLLHEIDYTNGKILFDLTTSERQDISGLKSLADIKIYNYDYGSNQYDLLKIVKPYQSYFEQGTDGATKRLRFDSLHITDATGKTLERYVFNYNPLMLPVVTSRARDYWGYYNGKANNSLIPNQTIYFQSGVNGTSGYDVTIGSSVPNSRYPDTSYNQACMLTRIYYPTGGYTDLTYETNRYTSPLTGNDSLSGGLRIKSIKSYESTNAAPLLKTYQYNASRPNYILSNYYFNTTQKYFFWNCIPAGTQSKDVTTYISNPNVDIAPYDGTLVVYPVVTEYEGSIANNTGKTVYSFTDYPDVLDASSSVRPVVNSYAYRRGQLKSKTVYRNNGLFYQPLYKEQYNYTAFPQTIYANVGFVIKLVNVEEGCVPAINRANDWLYSNYAITSDDNLCTSKTTIVYDQSDSTEYTSQTSNYTYGNIQSQQITKSNTINSKGDTLIEVKKYPADYIFTGSNYTSNPVLDSMLAYNMQATVIERWDSVKSVSGIPSLTGVTSGQLTVFKQLSPGVFKPDYISKLEINAPVTNFTPSSIVSGTLNYDNKYSRMVNFTGYDIYSNISEYSSRNTSQVSAIWDYKGSLLIAEAVNASSSAIAYTSFEADGSGGWSIPVSNRTKTTYVTGSQCYSLTNGPVSTINSLPSKQYKVTVWARTQPTVSGATGSPIIGRSFNGFKYYEFTTGTVTSVTISGTGLIDELRLYPQDAQMTTYTYEPLVGMTSQCDANDNITYYEYDGLGRLITIRDMDKNILKKFGYNYAGQKFVANTFTNQTHIKAFTKMSCSDTSLVAVELVDSVMAGSFFSEVSQGEADTMAINYLDSAGQANADLNGACAEPVTLTLVNYDHITDFTLTLTDVYDSTKTFTIPFPLDSAITTARIPQGRYDILIAKPGNVDSHVFTASGPGGSIEVNSSSGSWSNVYVNTDVFDKLTIGIPQ